MLKPSDPTQRERFHALRNTGGAMMSELAQLHNILEDAEVPPALFAARIVALEQLVTEHHQQLDLLVSIYEERLANDCGQASARPSTQA